MGGAPGRDARWRRAGLRLPAEPARRLPLARRSQRPRSSRTGQCRLPAGGRARRRLGTVGPRPTRGIARPPRGVPCDRGRAGARPMTPEEAVLIAVERCVNAATLLAAARLPADADD